MRLLFKQVNIYGYLCVVVGISVWCVSPNDVTLLTQMRHLFLCFTLQGTVEQRMEAVQARKQRMISGALTDQEVRSARIEELKMLFT
jgi:hypothetical protein